jgi:hypothetical protein
LKRPATPWEDPAVLQAEIPVPNALRRPHHFVAATRDAAKGLKPRDDGRLEVGPRPGVVHLLVSREHLHRALLILQAIFKEAERHGYEVKATRRDQGETPGVGIVVRGHAYPLYIAEQPRCGDRRRSPALAAGKPLPTFLSRRSRATGAQTARQRPPVSIAALALGRRALELERGPTRAAGSEAGFGLRRARAPRRRR